jgi:hypothetical protein
MPQLTTRFFAVTAVSAALSSVSPLVAAQAVVSPSVTAASVAPSSTNASTAAPSEAAATPSNDATPGTSTMTVISGSSTIQTAALAPESDELAAAEERYLANRGRGLWATSGLDLFVPGGSFDANDQLALSDAALPTAALEFVIGYRFNPNLAVGGFFDYAMGVASDNLISVCKEEDVSCSYLVARWGALLRHTINPQDPVAGWYSVGLGWSFFDSSAELGETPLFSVRASGKELVAKGGVNLGMQTGSTSLDIFVSASVGEWDELELWSNGNGGGSTRDNLGTYHWFGIGTAVNY